MNFIGNLIWLLFGGLISAIDYLIGGFVLCLTIIGISFGLPCFKLAISFFGLLAEWQLVQVQVVGV